MNFVEFILSSIPLLIHFYAEKYFQDDYSKTLQALEMEFNLPIPGTYDFIVVGAGTAGCVVAARLSEKYSVLLLEAGGNPPPAAMVPFFATRVAIDPNINYFFKSLPQTNASLFNGGILTHHLGKMMGGSGSHNELLHSRGSPRDFDNWATITNDHSWSYENVLKYFKMTEDFIGVTYDQGNDENYGRGGPIQVDTNVVPMLPLWFAAGAELGYEAADPNGFQRESFAPLNKATRRGRRSSSFTEYIQPIENTRTNLTVIRYANVSEILISDNKEAYGVAYTRHGIPQIAYANKEVVLSAGAFQSPLLLMKSGVGPGDTLSDANIPIKVPLEAVGQNLGGHPALLISPFYVNDSSLFDRIDPTQTEEMLREWHLTGEGTLGMLSEGPQCFIVSSKADPGWPDIWIPFIPHVMIGSEKQVLSFYVVHGRPKSRGYITLNGTAYREGVRDDVQLALIDFKLLTHPEDVEVMVEGIKFVLKIAEETNAFKSLEMTYGGVPDEACSQHEFRSDDYWKCLLSQRSSSLIHMAGTCSMGPENGSPATSVVDPKFRVRGVQNLRVIDGSIMPAVVNSNTNAGILMIGEKGADDIRAFWERK